MNSSDLLLQLETDKPSQAVQEKALRELRETPENIENGLKKLKKLLEAENNLWVPLANDEWLLMFLRTCKFYPDSARNLIKVFYGVRHKYAEVTSLLTPSRLKPVFEDNLVSILPQRDQHGRRIIVSICGSQWNYQNITMDEILAGSVLCADILQKETQTQINGVVYIMDLEGLTLRHAMQFTPYRVRRSLDFIQDQSPMRLKGFHIVNQPKIFQPIFAAVKPFFSSKFGKRILMHGHNYASLHQYISPECLPKCYGGLLETRLMYGHESYEILADHEQFLEGLTKFGLGMKDVKV